MNGVITEGKLTLKQQFDAEGKEFVDYEGVFKEKAVAGTYKAAGNAEFDEAGDFSLEAK